MQKEQIEPLVDRIGPKGWKGCYVCCDGISRIHAELPQGGECNDGHYHINYCYKCGRKLQENGDY